MLQRQPAVAEAVTAKVERDVTERTFRTYAEAAKVAAHIDIEDGLFAKVQVSRYGSGYVVRKLPVAFLLDPELKRRFVRPVEYSQL